MLGRTVRLLRREGLSGLGQRLVRKLYGRLEVEQLEFPLHREHVADSRLLELARPGRGPERGSALTVGWVTTPPGLGSGGHTTMFRMISGLEAAGHTCILFLYDRYDGDLAAQEAVIRRGWPTIRAEVRDGRQEITGVDAAVATSWPTAHVLARSGAGPMQRFYFVQDFEPYFYPRGSEYALAEDSYRFGYHCIATGHMVADALSAIGVGSDVVEFGCDVDVYHPLPGTVPRSGVVFFARPGVARRGYLLGCLALAEFHRLHPDQPIHVYGATDQRFDFPVTRHGRLSPPELNALYNRCVAGLALSFTNISLVAEEMLAAGLIPVVNDSADARADLSSPQAVFAPPTPSGLAGALSAAVSRPDVAAEAALAAASVRADNWRPAQQAVVRVIEDRTYR